jgi:hypothetical protein
MPHFTDRIVEPEGPIIDVTIWLSIPRRHALSLAGLPAPSPMIARLLIDTGASMTSLDDRFFQGLGLQPTGSVAMHTPSTGSTAVSVFTYDVEMSFAGYTGSNYSFPTMGVVGCDFSGQTFDGLFGRDALNYSRLIFSGPDETWMLSF